jgi:hypothetical protein
MHQKITPCFGMKDKADAREPLTITQMTATPQSGRYEPLFAAIQKKHGNPTHEFTSFSDC